MGYFGYFRRGQGRDSGFLRAKLRARGSKIRSGGSKTPILGHFGNFGKVPTFGKSSILGPSILGILGKNGQAIMRARNRKSRKNHFFGGSEKTVKKRYFLHFGPQLTPQYLATILAEFSYFLSDF